MKPFAEWIFLVILVAGFGYVAYTHPARVRSVLHMVRDTVAPCSVPLTYSIGTIDPRFGITKQILVDDLRDAETIWETSSGKDLLSYQQTGGDVTVSLVYDSRQASTDTLKSAGIQVDQSKESYDTLKARYAQLSSLVESRQAQYDARLKSFEQAQASYNTAVDHINARGGATPTEAEQLRAQKASLEQEFAAVQSLEQSVRGDIDTLNALATSINQLIVQLNLKVDQYNRTGAAAGEFEEGVYEMSDGVQTIDIYEYSDHVQLVRVLAHELGHALGLEHVEDKAAIMYKINSGKSLSASAADVTELKRVCRIGR